MKVKRGSGGWEEEREDGKWGGEGGTRNGNTDIIIIHT